MQATEQPDGSLLVTSSESWLLVLAVGLVALTLVFWILPSSLPQALGWTAGLGAGALLCLAGAERTRFLFDPAARRLTWDKRTIFRRTGGMIPFDQITCISLEQAWSEEGGRSNTRRVVIHTTAGVLPLSRSYGLGRARLERTAEAMRAAIVAGDPSRELPVVK